MMDKLTNMSVSSMKEDFFLELNPANEVDEINPEIEVDEKNTNPTSPYIEDEAPSCTVWQVTTGISIGSAAFFLFIIIYMAQRHKGSLLETGCNKSMKHSNSLDSERSMLQTNVSMEGSPSQYRDADEGKEERSTFYKAKKKRTSPSTSDQLRHEGGELRKRNPPRDKELYKAAMSGDLTMVKEAIRKGADLNYKDHDDATPLHEACWEGHLPIVKELLQAGAYIDHKTILGRTPLHAATDGGHLHIVKELLKAGANVNSCDNYGRTPLSIARREVHSDVEQLLIKEAHKISI